MDTPQTPTNHDLSQCADTNVPSAQFDPDDFRGEISELGFTKEQEDEFLLMLWNLIVEFVDIGFGTDATQLVLRHHFEKYFENEEKDEK